MKNVNGDTNLIYAIEKDDCLLNIVSLFGLVKKDVLKVHITRPRMFYEAVELHNLWVIE